MPLATAQLLQRQPLHENVQLAARRAAGAAADQQGCGGGVVAGHVFMSGISVELRLAKDTKVAAGLAAEQDS